MQENHNTLSSTLLVITALACSTVSLVTPSSLRVSGCRDSRLRRRDPVLVLSSFTQS